jgi:hypothetical protein
MVSRKIQNGTKAMPVKVHMRKKKKRIRVLVVQCRRVSHPQKKKMDRESESHEETGQSHRVVAMRNKEINKEGMKLYTMGVMDKEKKMMREMIETMDMRYADR